MGDVIMENTAVVTLLLLMFGQFLILTCGALLLWFMGDFGEKPRWFSRRKDQAQEPVAMPKRPSERAGKTGDSLVSLAAEHSIQPQATEEQGERVERTPERAEQKAENVPVRGFVA